MAEQSSPTEAPVSDTPEAMQTDESQDTNCTQPVATTDKEELQEPEQEKTLTDHLNKRLLESFLSRLDSGNIKLPQASAEEEGQAGDFDEQS